MPPPVSAGTHPVDPPLADLGIEISHAHPRRCAVTAGTGHTD
jgi:hypothetical protein